MTAPPERPLRIVYVTSSRGVGGAEQLLGALIAAGSARGWEQTLLNPFADAASAALAELCEPAARYEGRECATLLGLPGLRSWLAGRLAALRPDIVHVVLFHASVLTATVRRRGERRLLTHMYGEGLAQLAHPRTRGQLDRWAGRRFDHVSAISDAVRDFLARDHGYPPPPVGRIRLGWSGQPRPPQPAEGRAPTVVCVAALRREKGHDTLLAAFREVRRRIPAARLVLVGDGPHRPQVEAAVRAAGLEASVEMAGRSTDVWPFLADADVFALASPSEALGIAIMEAMAAGLPVVASDVGGIPELVTPGVTGGLFAVGDHRELADKLTALLESPARRRAMSAAALAAAPAMRMEQTVAENLRLYRRLLEAPGPARVSPIVGPTATRLKGLVWTLVTWPPLNRIATDALRALLPTRAQRHPRFVRFARRVGVVEAALPDGRRLRVGSRGDDDIAGPLFWRGWDGHETETARLFYELARTARVTLDVGAHVGYFALLAAHANPAGRVYAFEPLDRVRARLEANVALNGTANVSCLAVALGSPAGTAEFFHGADRMPSSSSLSRSFMQSVVPGSALRSSTVEVVEADDFVRAHGLTGVDLVKIDTETTEPAVVQGMLATLRRDRPQIVCEVLDDEVAAGLEVLLAPLGYEFFLLTADGPAPRPHIAAHPRWRNYLFRVPARR